MWLMHSRYPYQQSFAIVFSTLASNTCTYVRYDDRCLLNLSEIDLCIKSHNKYRQLKISKAYYTVREQRPFDFQHFFLSKQQCSENCAIVYYFKKLRAPL